MLSDTSQALGNAPEGPVVNRRRRVAVNLVANIAVQILNKLFPLIVYAYAQRKLGTESLGHALFALALVDWATPFIEAGTGNYGQIIVGREQKDPETLRRLLGDILAVKGLNTVIALIGLVLLVIAGPYSQYRDTVLAISFMTLATTLDMTYVQMGTQRIWALSVANALSKLFVLSFLFILVKGEADATHFAALMAGGNFLFGFATFLTGIRQWRPRLPSRAGILATYRAILPFAIGVGLYFGLDRFDYLLVGTYASPLEVGLYGGISRVFFSIQSLLPALAIAFGAEMLGAANDTDFSKQVERSLSVLALLVAPMVIGVWFVSRPLLSTIYDSTYEAAAPTFSLLCTSCAPYALFLIFGLHALTFRGAVRQVNVAAAAGLVAGISLGLILVPRIGIMGAAIAVMTAKIVAFLGILPRAKAAFDLRKIARYTAPSFAAAGLMGAALSVIGQQSLIVLLLVGALGYLPLALLFNARWLLPLFYSVKHPTHLGEIPA